jgi:hypothetical protein
MDVEEYEDAEAYGPSVALGQFQNNLLKRGPGEYKYG